MRCGNNSLHYRTTMLLRAILASWQMPWLCLDHWRESFFQLLILTRTQDKKGWLSYWFYSLRTLVSQEFSFSSSIPDVYKELHGTAC